MKLEANDKLYEVVVEEEDDPYCAHWDRTCMVTPNLLKAKGYAKEMILRNYAFYSDIHGFNNDCVESYLRNSYYLPRIKMWIYNSTSESFDTKPEGEIGATKDGYWNIPYSLFNNAFLEFYKNAEENPLTAKVTITYEVSKNDLFFGSVSRKFESTIFAEYECGKDGINFWQTKIKTKLISASEEFDTTEWAAGYSTPTFREEKSLIERIVDHINDGSNDGGLIWHINAPFVYIQNNLTKQTIELLRLTKQSNQHFQLWE